MIRNYFRRFTITDAVMCSLAILAVVAMVHNLMHPALGIALASVGLGRPILTQDELMAHKNNLSTQDVVWWPLYDANNWTTGGQTLLQYYTSPVGQGTTTAPGATGTKTLADTNLQVAGQLPKGNDYFQTGLEFLMLPGDVIEQTLGAGATVNAFANDVYNAGKSGVVTEQVGSNRVYLQDGPLLNFPPSARLFVAAAAGGSSTAGTQSVFDSVYASWVGDPYEITPIYIEATQAFQVAVQWPAAVTLVATARLYARMRGYLIRNAQ